ncbi:MAG TPA: VWA domain-containing protein [Solirubrobacteraceae bacterium]|jgi:Ca-activated chloride channel family protein|nr:VWA domain-containing protein [Solirubrobacteraceae bacterium]
MSFLHPAVLIALIAIPLLAVWYIGQQRRRRSVAAAFASPVFAASVTPRRPRWRRHLPMVAFATALAVLIAAAARPQRTVAVPVETASIMLANDTSGSMAAKDVAPSRLAAAEKAANQFLAKVPASVKVGLLEFNTHVALLQSPTTDHPLVSSALAQLRVTGGTAIGDALRTALHTLTSAPKVNGKEPPAAIVLLSDGSNDVGSDPITAAEQAASQHIPVYTVELGTAGGTVTEKRGNSTVTVPVPPNPQQLAEIARVSHGQAFTATDAKGLDTIYQRLGAELGHKKVKHEMTATFAGGGLALLLLGGVASLVWFGRLI